MLTKSIQYLNRILNLARYVCPMLKTPKLEETFLNIGNLRRANTRKASSSQKG